MFTYRSTGGEKTLNFAQKIRHLRKEKGLTLRELGEKINLNYSHLSRLESGKKTPNVQVIELLASFYKVSPNYFFDESLDTELTKDEEEFLEDIDLSLEEIKDKYNVTFEGKAVTDEELKAMLAYLKVKRGIDE